MSIQFRKITDKDGDAWYFNPSLITNVASSHGEIYIEFMGNALDERTILRGEEAETFQRWLEAQSSEVTE